MQKGISKKLLKNYMIMFILTIFLFTLTFVVLIKIGGSFNDYGTNNYAHNIMKDDYKKIDTEGIKKYNGTVFAVNEDLNIIPICGQDLPSNKSFTMSQWTEYINDMNKSDRNFQYYIDYNDREEFWLVVKMPVSVNLSFNFNINTTREVLPEALFIVAVLCLICLLIISLYIFIYSKLTSKYFIKPLDMFCLMVRNLEEGNYKNRIKINTDDEYQTLADSFNRLADSLDNEKVLRKQAEDNRKRLILDISHDMNNPLTSTIGSLELCLNQEDLSERQRHYIKMAYDNSMRSKALINELFEYSKLDSPDYRLKLEKVDFCEFMRMQIAGEIENLEQAGFTGEFDIDERAIYAEIDTTQFGRIIHNLIMNAVKYNKRGTKISISVKDMGKSISIIIKDDGIGIDKESAKSIFDVFVRGSAKSETNGTGLGLAIVKKIVTMHQGTISLQSDINNGCTFIIDIPKAQDN